MERKYYDEACLERDMREWVKKENIGLTQDIFEDPCFITSSETYANSSGEVREKLHCTVFDKKMAITAKVDHWNEDDRSIEISAYTWTGQLIAFESAKDYIPEYIPVENRDSLFRHSVFRTLIKVCESCDIALTRTRSIFEGCTTLKLEDHPIVKYRINDFSKINSISEDLSKGTSFTIEWDRFSLEVIVVPMKNKPVQYTVRYNGGKIFSVESLDKGPNKGLRMFVNNLFPGVVSKIEASTPYLFYRTPFGLQSLHL